MRISFLLGTAVLVSSVDTAPAQDGQRARPTTRAESLYVSNGGRITAARLCAGHGGQGADRQHRPRTARGVIDFQKVTYRSSVGDMDIPAYLFQPLTEARPARARGDGLGARRRARQLGAYMFPFVKRRSSAATSSSRPTTAAAPATARRIYNAIDYGGYEVDDVAERGRLPEDAAARRPGAARHHGLEPRRLHHAALGSSATRIRSRRRAAIVPVTNLVFRLVVQRARAISATSRRSSASGAAVREARRCTSSARRSITSTSCTCRCSCTSRRTTPT